MRPLNWLFGLRASDRDSVAQPLPPSKDPWYKAPAGFEAAQPGTILRIRPTPGDLAAVVGNASASYNILYRTTDSHLQPSWAVTTLFIPTSLYVSPSGKVPLLSYQPAYNTANLDSSPSFTLHRGQSQAVIDIGMRPETLLFTEMLGLGWIVNVPDFEGPTAAFGAGVLAGRATLDSIRAVLGLARLTGADDMTTAIWGYSGGSLATGAAAEMQVQYAPELDISGVVLGGLLDNLSDNLHLLNKSPLSSNIVNGLLGLMSQYPEAAVYVRSRLRPETADEFLSAKDISSSESIATFAMKDVYSYFVGGEADLQTPMLRRILNAEGRRGTYGVPAMPMFIYKAIGDQFCQIGLTDSLVDTFSKAGANITYERNTVGGHVSEIENGEARVIKWLWSIYDESYTPSTEGCTIRDVAVKVSPLNV
ncbi:LIP-domain-containing protein [Hypoxylon rubiginosum]|uniref:LIP-domain-containing protein n=1 Tax=Hypoxylon rubiginosum TaxID=110542 RepID=A0ACB9YVU8_9PEZI|nr:LIP-domain-containing protein [Hypoxylon rubiginosum]